MIVAWILGAAFAVILGSCGVARVLLGGVGVYDLAIFHSALLNTFDEGFYFTYLQPEGSLFYQHFDPIVLALLPFYVFLGNAAWPILPISQCVAIAMGFPALARIGRQEGLSPRLCLVLPALCLMNPALHNIAWYDFHPVVFAFPLLLWGWAFNREGRLWPGAVCWALAMLCKENVSLTVSALGILLAVEGNRKSGLIWAAGGAICFVVITGWIIPAFRDIGEGNIFLVRYSWMGDSPIRIATTLLTRPVFVMTEVFSRPATWPFIWKLLLPLGLLPLLAPRQLFAALPEAGVLMLSSFVPMQQIKFHYPVLLMVVLTLASVRGLANLRRLSERADWNGNESTRLRGTRWVLWAFCLLGAVASLKVLYTDGRSLPMLRNPERRGYYVPEPRRLAIERISAMIPPDASASLPLNLLNPIYPFVSRPLVAFLPDRSALADFVVFDVKTGYFGGYKEPGLDQLLEKLEQSVVHEVVYDRDEFIVFRRIDSVANDPSEKRKIWRQGEIDLQF